MHDKSFLFTFHYSNPTYTLLIKKAKRIHWEKKRRSVPDNYLSSFTWIKTDFVLRHQQIKAITPEKGGCKIDQGLRSFFFFPSLFNFFLLLTVYPFSPLSLFWLYKNGSSSCYYSCTSQHCTSHDASTTYGSCQDSFL